ncbi:MAG: DUF2155 domain-containing protein [Alphaproteobacteria bacterium]
MVKYFPLLPGLAALALLAGPVGTVPTQAGPIANQIAVYSGLDKITATISTIEVHIGQTVRFGTLIIRPRACYTRPPIEPPKTTSFVEIDEQQLDGTAKRIFTGWMFAANPGLYGVEHPVYDVWLKDCKTSPTKGSAPILKKLP